MKQSIVLNAMFILLLSILTGCSDNKQTEAEPVANVALAAMDSPSNEVYKAGQYIDINFTTNTQLLNTEHVGVSFMLIARDKVDELETSDNPTGFELGEHYIAKLSEGLQQHHAKLLLPNDISEAGEYVIAAYVDASGMIENEADVSDNRSRNFANGDYTTYAIIDIAEGHVHDFSLDKLKVGDGFALFPGPGKRETSSVGAPQVTSPDLIGFIKASKLGNEVNAVDVTAQVKIGNTSYDVHLWNEGEQKYTHNMAIIFPDHEQSHFFPWDIAINGKILKAIHDHYNPDADSNTFTLTFSLEDTSALIEENNDNNSVSLEVPYVLYHDEVDTSTEKTAKSSSSAKAAASSTSKVASWSATYGDSDVVAISPSFYSYMYLTSSDNGYAKALAEGDLDLVLFDNDLSLVSASAQASASVADAEIDYSLEFSVLGTTLLDEADTKTALDKSFGYSWSEEQTLVSSTFTIVIVPVTVKAGVSGSLDFAVGLSYGSNRLELGGDIVTTSLDAYATASIDLAVASGGVGVDFLIIADTFNVTAYADFSDAITDNEITFGLEAGNDIEAISGEFYLWVKYPYYKWCCTVKTKKKTYTLYETDSLYDKTWTILDESATFSF